jgi:hypothetical protein
MNLTMWCRITLCVLLGMMVSGCTVERTIALKTDPQGAKVTALSGRGVEEDLGNTQLTHTFKFDSDPSKGLSTYNLTFSLKCYEVETIVLRAEDAEQKVVNVELKPQREVTLNSKPKGAKVTVSSDRGLKDFFVGETPIAYTFKFGTRLPEGPSIYNTTFSLKGYESKTVTLAAQDCDQTSISVELEPNVVREVKRLEPVISEKAGYTVEPRTVRAWVEDIEREGMAASNIVKLGDFQYILGMTLASDGNTLIFSLGETVKDEQGNEKRVANLRSIQTRGGGITEVTSGQWLDTSPAISTNDSLLFCSDRLRKQSADIFRISLKKTSAIAVIRQTSDGVNYQPSVAENGVIAFTYRPDYHGQIFSLPQIWTLGGENQYPTQLREGQMPAISLDGTQIVYIGSDKQLWKMPVNGQNPIQLTNTPVNLEGKKHPSWSHDGKYVLYASDEAKDSKNVANYDIWIICEDGTNPRQLTTNGSVDDIPVVSPDQKYIYFVSNRGFRDGIWRIPFPKSD